MLKNSFAYVVKDDSFGVRYPTDVKSTGFQSQLVEHLVCLATLKSCDATKQCLWRGYYKFISAGHSLRETNLFRSPSHNREKKKNLNHEIFF